MTVCRYHNCRRMSYMQKFQLYRPFRGRVRAPFRFERRHSQQYVAVSAWFHHLTLFKLIGGSSDPMILSPRFLQFIYAFSSQS